MGYLATTHTYHNWTKEDTANALKHKATEKPRTAYRGVVREYTDSPIVIIHQCPNVHYNRSQALTDSKKLIIKLKKQS